MSGKILFFDGVGGGKNGGLMIWILYLHHDHQIHHKIVFIFKNKNSNFFLVGAVFCFLSTKSGKILFFDGAGGGKNGGLMGEGGVLFHGRVDLQLVTGGGLFKIDESMGD